MKAITLTAFLDEMSLGCGYNSNAAGSFFLINSICVGCLYECRSFVPAASCTVVCVVLANRM